MKKGYLMALLSITLMTSFASAKPTLTIYSYDSFTSEWGPGPKLKKTFEKQCDCDVSFISFEDSVILFNRLRLEGNNTQADVIIGLDNHLLKEAQATHLFAENKLDISQLKLPIKWQDKRFIPYDYGQYAFIYNAEKLKTPPKSLKNLVERTELSVIYQDPRTSTVGRGLLAWINEVYGDKAELAWKKLAKHTVTVGKGWSETYGAFLKGESDLVLSYNTSPLYHQIYEQKNNYIAAIFEEGHMIQIELAARLKSSENKELSEAFLTFLLTPESQKVIALSNIMLPVIKTDVDPKFNAFKLAKTLNVHLPEKSESKRQINVWQQAVSQ